MEQWTKRPVVRFDAGAWNPAARYAGCLTAVLACLMLFVICSADGPTVLNASAEPTPPPGPLPPHPPPPTAGQHPPVSIDAPFPLPFESPAVMGEEGSGNAGRVETTIIQPHLSFTQSIEPVVRSVAVPMVLGVFIGLAVIEKIKVRKKKMVLRVAPGE